MTSTTEASKWFGTSILQQTLMQVERLVGRENITWFNHNAADDEHRRNVSLFRPRNVHAIVRPGSVEEVQERRDSPHHQQMRKQPPEK